jgi:hypothetical protein
VGKKLKILLLTDGAMSRFALQKCSDLAQMLLANLLIARVSSRFLFTNLIKNQIWEV